MYARYRENNRTDQQKITWRLFGYIPNTVLCCVWSIFLNKVFRKPKRENTLKTETMKNLFSRNIQVFSKYKNLSIQFFDLLPPHCSSHQLLCIIIICIVSSKTMLLVSEKFFLRAFDKHLLILETTEKQFFTFVSENTYLK